MCYAELSAMIILPSNQKVIVDLTEVAAELSASPFPLLRERALEADPSCIPRMRQVARDFQ